MGKSGMDDLQQPRAGHVSHHHHFRERETIWCWQSNNQYKWYIILLPSETGNSVHNRGLTAFSSLGITAAVSGTVKLVLFYSTARHWMQVGGPR